MANLLAPAEITEVMIIRLVNELARDINPLDTILEKLGISPQQFDHVQQLPRFRALLLNAAADWESAQNTPERVKLKSAFMMEQALEEVNTRIHDAREPLSAKTELLKLVARLASLGNEKIEGHIQEKFHLTINIGDNAKHEIRGVTSKVIEHSNEM